MYFARCRTALQSRRRLLLASEPGSQIPWGSTHHHKTAWPPPPPTTRTMTGPMNATLPLQVPPLLPDADGQPKTIRSSGDAQSPIPRLEKHQYRATTHYLRRAPKLPSPEPTMTHYFTTLDAAIMFIAQPPYALLLNVYN